MPRPAEKSCPGPNGSAEQCPEGLICVPSCRPSWCFCDTQFQRPSWACSTDCAGECYDWPEPAGPATHTITDLGTLGGWEGIAHAINNYGDVVGESNAADGKRQATLWADGSITSLYPGAQWSRGVDINNQGQVAVNYASRSWLWQEDSGLDQLEGLLRAHAINDAAQVIGDSSAGLGSVLWEDGVITSLSQTIGIWAEDINNLAHVAGSVELGMHWHAAVWDGFVVKDLATLGGLSSGASEINDLGQVIGESERAPGGDRIFYGFFWDGQAMHDVTELVGYDSWVLALNNCGEVLLLGTRRNDEGFYVYQTGGGVKPVRGVLGPGTGWWNLLAWDMNDQGEIVGFGSLAGPSPAFLIEPVSGDLDWDGDIDLRDCAEFTLRFTGSRAPAIPGCERADLDRDADVDLHDFAEFQNALTGPK